MTDMGLPLRVIGPLAIKKGFRMELEDFLDYVNKQTERQYLKCPHCKENKHNWGEDFNLIIDEWSEWVEIECKCGEIYYAKARTLLDFEIAKKEVLKMEKVGLWE